MEDIINRKMQLAIDKALSNYTLGLKDKIAAINHRIDHLNDPLNQQLLKMKSESESYARQNMKFLKLYHECLTFLQTEVKEKKRVLDTAQLAFLTADPGAVQQTVASHLTVYKKKHKPLHGYPSQMDN